MNKNGQTTVEYMLMISIFLLIILSTTNIILEESEKNTILNAAQIGAHIGVDKNAFAMYYNDTFNNYEENYQRLLYPTEIKVINISLEENNNILYLQVYLHSNTELNEREKYIIGYRVNYYVRKTISEAFNLNSNPLYDNITLNKYKIRNNSVKWV